MQFKVPQNIDIEDKIVGSLTLIQFSYLLVGGVICYIFFKSFPRALFILLSIPVVFSALFFTFVKIQEQTFAKFLKNLFLYYTQPKERIWHKGPTALTLQENPKIDSKQPQPRYANKKVFKTELESLSQILDTGSNLPPKVNQGR